MLYNCYFYSHENDNPLRMLVKSQVFDSTFKTVNTEITLKIYTLLWIKQKNIKQYNYHITV